MRLQMTDKMPIDVKYAVAIGFDVQEDKIYWSDLQDKAIKKAFTNGSNVEIVSYQSVLEIYCFLYYVNCCVCIIYHRAMDVYI